MRKFLFKYIIPRFYYILFGVNICAHELELKETDKCLCLAPHADDESIGMAGTLTLYPEKFDVICLTDGSRAGSALTKEELIEKREQEFNTALDLAKVQNRKSLKMPDRKMILDSDTYQQIDISEYDYIFIPNIMDQHRDHKSTAALVNILLKKPHKKELKICFYEVWSTLALPNTFVDITNVIENKRNMINCYQSQLGYYDYTEKMLSLNKYRGLQFSRDCVESFMEFDIKTFKRILKACSI